MILYQYKKEMIAYQAMYCSSTLEGYWHIISIHFTKEGSEKAMNKHKENEHQNYLEAVKRMKSTKHPIEFKFGEQEDWKVTEIKIIE